MPQVRSRVTTVLACVLVWGALVLPDRLGDVSAWSLLRVPLEALLLVALLLVLPERVRRPVAVLTGMALALAVLLKALDLGFSAVLDRRFHELYDWTYLAPAFDVLRVWVGGPAAVLTVVLLALVLLGALALMVPATLRVARLVATRRRATVYLLVAGGTAWVLLALAGTQVNGQPAASASTSRLLYDHATAAVADYRAVQVFDRAVAQDPLVDGGDDLLAGLRGKDVLLVWVESYGRVALTDPTVAPGVRAALDDGTERLEQVGVSARSGYLTSPTFGGSSWLAHATLQSGVWTDNQRLYDRLLPSDRLTLTSAFGQAGWRTAFVLPAVREEWPEGRSFYGFDTLLHGGDLGYAGPELGWGGIPDQFTLAAVRRSLLDDPGRQPVMAQVDLITSHFPWPPPPPLVDRDEVGDGSTFGCMPGCGRDPAEVEGMEHARERYGQSVEHVLRTVVSFVEDDPDPDLVVVLLGDHQPWTYVTGPDPGHDVPVTILSADPAVLDRVADWGWTPGLRPAEDAPVWRMDAFRDRFLAAFG